MAKDDFLSDPRNKLGGDVDWEDASDDLARDLANGTVVRPNGMAGVADTPEGIELTTDDLLKLRALFANYR